MDHLHDRDVWDANAASWIELSRAGFDAYRDLVNTPAFFALLPDVSGLEGLDLGCGEGHNTRLLAERSAAVTAVDISETFLNAAASVDQSDESSIAYVRGDALHLPFAAGSFDFAVAFMSLMDTRRPEPALTEVRRVLRPDGFLQFSITHPVTDTRIRRWVENDAGEREALAIGGYFEEGWFESSWSFPTAAARRPDVPPFRITSARRTLATWINALISAGFVIDAVAEPRPDEKTAAQHPEISDARIAPYFLLIRALSSSRSRTGG